jgi:hypothetical protein
LPVALSKCPSVRILIVPVNLGVRRADRPTDVPREALAGRQVVPVLVAALDVRVRVARRVRVATVSRADLAVTVSRADLAVTVSRAGSVEMAMVMTVDRVLVGMTVDRVLVGMTVGPVATVSLAVLDVMAMARIAPAVMARVRVARRVLDVMVMVRIVPVVMARVLVVRRVRVATVSRAVLDATVMVRIVPVVMARARVGRRVRVATVSRADLAVTVSRADLAVTVSRAGSVAMTTSVVVVTSCVGRVSPGTKRNVVAWRCAPRVVEAPARISSRRAKSAWPNNGSMKVRSMPPSCATPPRRQPSARLARPARMANSIPR